MESGIIMVLVILGVTATMLVINVFRMAIGTIGCMLALDWTSVSNPYENFSGFPSIAVIAMLIVMILEMDIACMGIKDKILKFIFSRVDTNKCYGKVLI